MRSVRRRQRNSDSLTIKHNSISASEAKEVGFKDMMNNFGLGRARPRRIFIAYNEINSDKSWSVGIGNLFNNNCNLLVEVIFLLVVALIPLGLWKKWARRPRSANPLNFTNIQKLNGSNYKKWKQEIDIQLGLLEYDVALREEKPAALTAESTETEKSHFANWEKTNRLSLLIIQNAMEEHVRGGIKKCDTAKDFLAAISEKYQKSQKVEIGNFLSTFTTMKHDGTGSVREHLLKMVDVANKLTSLEIPINDEFIVHMALNSLTPEYEQIKVSYHTQKDKWSVNELISICCEQEDRLKKGKIVAVNLVDTVNGKKAGGPKKNGNQKFGGSKKGSNSGKKFSNDSAVPAKNAQNPPTSENLKVNKKIAKCYFCQKSGHV